MKENVVVTIKNLDQKVPVEENSAGTYHYKNNKHYCLLENGDRLILSEEALSVRRKGVDLLFSMTQPLSCLYPTDFGSLPLTFDQVVIHAEETDHELRISLTYRLSQGDNEVGKEELDISIREASKQP